MRVIEFISREESFNRELASKMAAEWASYYKLQPELSTEGAAVVVRCILIWLNAYDRPNCFPLTTSGELTEEAVTLVRAVSPTVLRKKTDGTGRSEFFILLNADPWNARAVCVYAETSLVDVETLSAAMFRMAERYGKEEAVLNMTVRLGIACDVIMINSGGTAAYDMAIRIASGEFDEMFGDRIKVEADRRADMRGSSTRQAGCCSVC